MTTSVIVVGFGPEPGLHACLESILRELRTDDDLIVVDNGIEHPVEVPGVRVVRAERNLGFAGGCHLGAAESTAELLVFVNSDALLAPGALAALADELADPTVGLVSGCVVLADDPNTVNAAGNPVHVTGLSWAGGLGEPVTEYATPREVTSVSGALFATRRDVWDRLGGLREDFFLYYEDTDLSLRCWLAGLRVTYRPDAIATHSYEFARHPRKMFLVDRNRLASVLTVYPDHLLRRALPVIVVCEALLLLVAVRDGWARQKLRVWASLARDAGRLRQQRRALTEAAVHPRALDGRLVTRLGAPQVRRPPGLGLLDRAITTYWRHSEAVETDSPRVTRPDVVVLRSNPRDSSLPRLLTVLTSTFSVRALVWDRTGDYTCPVRSPRLELRRNTVPGRYHHASTLLGIARLQPWLLWQTLKARPRAVHAMDLDTGVVGLVAAHLLRVPFVYQCLDPYSAALPSGWPGVLARLVTRLEDAVVTRADLFVITDMLRMPQHAGATPRRVVELPNIPMTSVVPTPFSGSGLVVGYIGSLVPHRALDVLVDTVGGLADDGVTLVLGGFGPLENDLRAQASQYPNVRFLGWVGDEVLVSTMGDFDVFVQVEDPGHPAYRWVSPNKLFESMAFGRPIVVATGTLAADRAAETGHGVLVPYGDHGALRAVLIALLDDPAGRHELGAAGRGAFEDNWTPGVVSERVSAPYLRLVRASTRGASFESGTSRPHRVDDDSADATPVE